ncbi:MAG: TonB-dependent receptor [Sphingomonas sp.]
MFGYSDGKYQGNPNLKPELSRGWEAGIEQEFLDKHVVIGATYFDNRFLHQIDTTYILVGGQYVATTFNNDVRTRQQGVEAYGNARFGEWRIDASYTYLHAPQTIQALADPAPPGGGFQSPVPITSQAVRRPKNSGSVNLTYAPAALPLTATLTVRYNGRQRDYAFNSDYSRLLVDMKAYTLVNLNLTYDIGRHFQIFGRVENLFGETYQEVFTFATPGRAAYGGASFRF